MRIIQIYFLLSGVLLLTFFPVDVGAQQPDLAGQMSFSDLVDQAAYALEHHEPDVAVSLLEEIISRAGSLTADEAKASVQTARLHLASACLTLGRQDDARQYVKDYLAHDPVDNRPAARLLLCQIALATENWEDLEATAQDILADKNSGLQTNRRAKGFLLQAAFHLEKYNEVLDLLPEVLAYTDEPTVRRAYRIMQLRSLFETGQTEALITSLPVLFRGDRRNDITLNLTLLRIGDLLFDRQQYRNALAIYRLVVPKKELLLQQESPEDNDAPQTLEALRAAPDYDVHIAFRAAQIYAEQKRFWEAVALFDRLYLKYPDLEAGRSAYLQELLLLYTIGAEEEAVSRSIDYLEKHSSGFYPRVICTQLAQHYLKKKELRSALALSRYLDRWPKPADSDELVQQTDLLYLLSFVNFQLGEYDAAYQAFDRVIQTAPDSAAAMESNYWKAMCRLLQQNYKIAYDLFVTYRATWPQAEFAPAALFRAGVCRFGLEDYEGAKTDFKTFIDTYSDDPLMPEALSMYGDLLGADGLIAEALAQYDWAFQIVEKNYAAETDPSLKAQITAPATYATFQAALALTADAEAQITQNMSGAAQDAYRQLIRRVQLYMQTFGTDADWAKGVFWIGKAQIELGTPDKAVDAYLDAVVRFGTDPAQEGVSAILFDLAGIIKTRLNQTQRDRAVQTVREARTAAESPTLQISLDVLLAEMDGTQADLGLALLDRGVDLAAIPPSGLALMCYAQLDQQDFSRAEEFFDHFAQHYETSPYRVSAYHLRAKDLFRQKTDAAYEILSDALASYGAIAETGWAQLMKGKIELERGEYKAAAETLQVIPTARVWRGPVAAEAMFRLGEAWDLQKNYEKAFAFYQRTYLLYKTYDGGRWAAEGYLRSAQCLSKMGRVTAARNTYRAMLLDKYVRTLPQAQIAKDALGPAETAELLAGRTNTIESVEKEMAP